MAVIKCEKCGFHYDDDRYKACPNCGRDDLIDDHTVALPDEMESAHPLDETVNFEVSIGRDIADDVTVGEYSSWRGTSPVVGWLVCVEGVPRGRDFRLHHGWNRIGRSPDMGVYIADDQGISREHSAIAFDERSCRYYLVNNTGALTYLNEEPVTEPKALKEGDVISMGACRFVFIPFCTEDRRW